jgi:RHH-type transcriptional regulator, rel operon repressor / antitoxin RelB
MNTHTLQFDAETEGKITTLAAKGGKRPDDLIKEAVLEYLEDLEDYYVAEDRLKDREPPIPLEQVVRDLGLED